jgi:hypothetical protein
VQCKLVDFLLDGVGSDLLVGTAIIAYAMTQALPRDEMLEMETRLDAKVAAQARQRHAARPA